MRYSPNVPMAQGRTRLPGLYPLNLLLSTTQTNHHTDGKPQKQSKKEKKLVKSRFIFSMKMNQSIKKCTQLANLLHSTN